MDYVLHIATLAALYVILAQSLNFFSGYTGLLSLVHAGFYGVGAYVWALMMVRGAHPLAALVVMSLIVVTVAYLASLAAFRTKSDYFVIVTLSLQMLLFSVFNNLTAITNGPLGIAGIPRANFMETPIGVAIGAVLFAGLFYLLLWRLGRSSWGYNLRAIRDDEILAMALGKPVARIKTVTFIVGAIIAACAGAFYAQYVTFIDPTSFTIAESIMILAMVIVGGLGSIHGAALAAIALTVMPEVFRFVGMPGLAEGNARQMLYGAALVLIMLLRLGGPTYARWRT